MKFLLASLTTLILGLLLTRAARSMAHRVGFVAAPRRDRWHSKPTALMGGVAIYAAFVVGSVLFLSDWARAFPVLLSASLLFVVGLVDDLSPIKPYKKLIAQLVAAGITVYCGLRLPWTTYAPLNDLLTIFWLVGITNAVNLLDNMDGLAGGVSFIACEFLAVCFFLNGQPGDAMLPLLLGGAVLGFLFYNFNPASIFMGDCGSMFLGFMLGGTALLSNYGRTRNLMSVLLTPMLVLLIPIFDTCLVTVARKLSGRPISQGGRDHTSHRLVALGMSERRAVLMIYVFAVASSLLALMVQWLQTEVLLLLIPGFAVAVVLVGLYIGAVRIYQDEQPPTGWRVIRSFAASPYRRRMAEVLLDVVLVGMAYYGAFLLRWDGNLPPDQMVIFARTLPLVMVLTISCFLFFGVYRRLWDYTDVHDLLGIVKAVGAAGLLTSGGVLAMYKFGVLPKYNSSGPSRASLLLSVLLLLVFVTASRWSFRLIRALIVGRAKAHPEGRPVLIYGTGERAELLLRELITNSAHCYTPCGFVDPDASKAGKMIAGHPIFSLPELPAVISQHKVGDVLLADDATPASQLQDLLDLGVSLKRMSILFEAYTPMPEQLSHSGASDAIPALRPVPPLDAVN